MGRLASSIAMTLMGKHKPVYHPGNDSGDYVVVTNCSLLNISGRKTEQKIYRKHTQTPGGLKEMSLKRLVSKQGYGEVLRKAVSGMLPKNSLRRTRLARLKTFEGPQNIYDANTVRHWVEKPEVIKYNSAKAEK